MVSLVYLVYLVCLVCLVEPDKTDKPDRPNRQINQASYIGELFQLLVRLSPGGMERWAFRIAQIATVTPMRRWISSTS